MENLALIDSFSEFKDDKLIDRVTLMAILEDVFRNALKKKYGSDDNFDIIINPDKGDMEIWRRSFRGSEINRFGKKSYFGFASKFNFKNTRTR